MQIFDLSKSFPKHETYSLTDQIRRSSRSVCANLAEAWRKRRYERAFISKLSEAEGEAAETQVWLTFAFKSGYVQRDEVNEIYQTYNEIIRTLVGMINHPETWTIGGGDNVMREESGIYVIRSDHRTCHRVIVSSCRL